MHYTVLEAPSCQMNRYWPYQYRNQLYRYRAVLVHTLQYAFHGKWISTGVYAITTHIESSSVFTSQETQTVPTVFPFINFSCKGSFLFDQSSKRLTTDLLRCEHRHFYTITSVELLSLSLFLTKNKHFLPNTPSQEPQATAHS